MANPQKENGFTSIANEILEAIVRFPFAGQELRVLFFILRFSYGFQRKHADLPLTFIARGTNISRRGIAKVIKRLVSYRALVRSESRCTFNKNWEEWLVPSRTPSAPQDTRVVPSRTLALVPCRAPNKEIVKKTIKEKNARSDDPASVSIGKSDTDDLMTVSEFVAYCDASPQRHVRIIGNWADTIEPPLATKGQWKTFMTRNFRAARQLAPFSDDQLKVAFQKIREAQSEGWLKKFTLETLIKFIV